MSTSAMQTPDMHRDDRRTRLHGLFPRPRRSASRAAGASQASGGGLLELATLSGPAALDTRVVTLSGDETQVCARVAQLLLREATHAYEETLDANQQPQVDPRQWKLVKKKDQLCAYKQRREAVHMASFGRSAGLDTHSGSHGRSAAETTTLPLLLVTGTLAGRVDDAMLGLVSANTRAMRLNASYAQDSLEDSEVLATLQRPTVEQPFRFLGLKWAVRRHESSSAASFLKRRDLLYLEATGTTTLSNGDRVGFRVLHSVGVKALAQLSAISTSAAVVRARVSLCQLFHQQNGSADNGGSLRVFSRGYYDPRGGMMQFMAVNVAADLLLHMAFSAVDCAHLKKLAFAAQQAGRSRRASSQRRKTTVFGRGTARGRRTSMDGIAELDGEDGNDALDDLVLTSASASACAVCSRRLGSVLGRAGTPCAVCTRAACSRCSVVKNLHFSRGPEASTDVDLVSEETNPLAGSMGLHDFEQLSSHGTASRASTERSRSSRSRSRSGSGTQDVSQQPFKFCLPCVMRATQRSAAQLAVEELLEKLTMEPSPGPMDVRGTMNARSTWDCPPSHRPPPRPMPMRRRSTQTGRAYSSHGIPPSLSPSPYVQEPHYAQAPHYQPRKKAFSTAPLPMPTATAMRRASALATPVMLYVEDPVVSPRSAA